MAIRNFKLPPAIKKKMWSLTDKECLFLDMTLVFPLSYADLYKMALGKDITDAQCRTRASGVVTSADGKEYLEMRIHQLSEFFFPEKKNIKQKGADGFSEGYAESIIEVLERESLDPNSPIRVDALKMAITKIQKDIAATNSADPPKRYLPVTCSECAYNQWINTNCEILCGRCKNRNFAIANGLELSYQEMLEPEVKLISDEKDEKASEREREDG